MILLAAGILVSILCFMPRENTILSPDPPNVEFSEYSGGTWENGVASRTDFRPDHAGLGSECRGGGDLLPDHLRAFSAGSRSLAAALIARSRIRDHLSSSYIPGITAIRGCSWYFAVFLYWLAMDRAGMRRPRNFRAGSLRSERTRALPLIFLGGIIQLRETAWRDIRLEMSSSKAFGEFLQDPQYRDAILLPEPDYLIESVAYYADNDIYLPREGRFSKTVSWTTDSSALLSMEDLLAKARELQSTYGRPVLIVLGHFDLDLSQAGELKYSYNKHLPGIPAARRIFCGRQNLSRSSTVLWRMKIIGCMRSGKNRTH